MRVGIFIADSNGGYPVPASKGGAVSILVEHLIRLNEKKKLIDMEVISFYDSEAEVLAKKYPSVKITWIRIPRFIKWLDELLFGIIKFLFRKKKAVSYKSTFSLLFYIVSASKIVKKQRYDKIVLENNVPLAWIIKLSKYKGDYYYHFHNVPRINAGCKKVFENCKAILCVSKYVAEQIMLDTNPIGPIDFKRIRVLYNCIDTNVFFPESKKRRSDFRAEFNVGLNKKVILFVGRLSEEKGIDKLLEAVKEIDDENLVVLITGSYIHNYDIKDDYQCKLHEISKLLGDRIKFTGYIPQSDISKLYNIANVVVLPSMWDEPAGLTMIEAMACGIPLITTNSGGIPEYSGNCSIILERDDKIIENIKNEICNILNSDEKDVIVEKAVERINKEFSLNQYLERFYESIS